MKNNKITIEVPDWCLLGMTVLWHAPHITGYDWVEEEVISYGYDGFFHKGPNCPVYYSKFTEYGKTIKESIQEDEFYD